MRNVLLALLVTLAACSQHRKVQTSGENTAPTAATQTAAPVETVSPDTIPLRQIDGTVITLLGIGNPPLAYTETVDGYTVVLNREGIYEYARLDRDGDLVPSGTKANDPKNRDKAEVRYVEKLTKHLRYQGEKLKSILERHNKLNTTPKIEKK